MRHRVYGKHLGRNKNERQALFKGLVYSLLSHGTIQTSEAKAKAIKGLIDKIINSAKDKHSQGQLQSYLTDKLIRERLIKEIVPKLGAKTSGYTSIVKMGTRLGDQTRMVRMSLIGAEELKPVEKVISNKAQETSKKIEKVSKVSDAKKATPVKKGGSKEVKTQKVRKDEFSKEKPKVKSSSKK